MTPLSIPIASRIGALLYLLWGAMHIGAAWQVTQLALEQDAGIVQGRLFQNAWHLLIIAGFAIVISLWQFRTNANTAHWLNGVVVTLTDVGFIILVLLPGFVPWIPGVFGPIVWLLALLFSALGKRSQSASAFSSISDID